MLSGKIFFQDARSFTGATVYIRLEDVSCVDAPSEVISEQVIHDVSHSAGSQQSLDFNVYGSIPDNKAMYIISVHVDVDNDGYVSQGDYLSMESYPVLTYGYPNIVTIWVREVK